ncbi:hypothetical protein [Nostoc sp. FACHB-892]|uniref:hypothetical protein n=1 Tax=Nostoc sp. FACHB-892 TaxID=2692843 RepID=UPI0016868AA8|nr:hypothetical protein [Nostoc sp. FACHB-892]
MEWPNCAMGLRPAIGDRRLYRSMHSTLKNIARTGLALSVVILTDQLKLLEL